MENNEKVCCELAFTKSKSVSEREKVKSFWKFLDTETKLKPYSLDREKATQTETIPCTSKEPEKKKTWSEKLKVFRELGFDEVALAAAENCRSCLAEKRYNQCSDFADTTLQSRDELNEEIRAFEQRLDNAKKKESTTAGKLSAPRESKPGQKSNVRAQRKKVPNLRDRRT